MGSGRLAGDLLWCSGRGDVADDGDARGFGTDMGDQGLVRQRYDEVEGLVREQVYCFTRRGVIFSCSDVGVELW